MPKWRGPSATVGDALAAIAETIAGREQAARERRERERAEYVARRDAEQRWEAAWGKAIEFCYHRLLKGASVRKFYRQAGEHFCKLAGLIESRGWEPHVQALVGDLRQDTAIEAQQQLAIVELLLQAAELGAAPATVGWEFEKTAVFAKARWGLAEECDNVRGKLEAADRATQLRIARTGQADLAETGTRKSEPWWHSSDEERPEQYRHGPLKGTKAELGIALGGAPSRNVRTLELAARKGAIWVVRQSRKCWEVYLQTEGSYLKTQGRLEALIVKKS